MSEKTDDKPVTGQEMDQIMENRLDRFYVERIEPGIFRLLVRFYHDVIQPEFSRMVDEKVEARVQPLRGEIHQGFDDLYRKFQDLDVEYQAVKVGLARVEERLSRVERKLSH